MSKENTIIIEVRGGVVQAVYADTPCTVKVLDWDDYNASTNLEEQTGLKKLEDQSKTLQQVY